MLSKTINVNQNAPVRRTRHTILASSNVAPRTSADGFTPDEIKRTLQFYPYRNSKKFARFGVRVQKNEIRYNNYNNFMKIAIVSCY